jgi:hypothetical protein
MNLIRATMIKILSFSKKWNFNDHKEFNDISSIANSGFYHFVKKYMPMMHNDKIMINRIITMINSGFVYVNINSDNKIKKIVINKSKELLDLYAGYDMHCKPSILLHLQSEIDFIDSREKYTTHRLSNFIWDYSSCINWRDKESDKTKLLTDKNKIVLHKLHIIQKNFYDKVYDKNNLQIISEYDKKLSSFVPLSKPSTIDKIKTRFVF